MRPVGDQKYVFITALILSWLLLIGLPITYAILRGSAALGLPLLGVVVWFALLRLARRVSPPVRADAKMRRGKYLGTLKLCDRALAVTGSRAWTGRRRLIWLNRRVLALLALGRGAEALATSLEAVRISADPETLANCAEALLLLNRYEEASRAARSALDLSRERSVSANATLAAVMLARGQPAEAEALARAGLVDIEQLAPLKHPEHHVACLAMLCRAERALGRKPAAARTLVELRRVAGRKPALHVVALLEQAASIADSPAERDRAFSLLEQARRILPQHVLWYISQPDTLHGLHGDQRLPLFVAAVKAPIARELAFTAPTEREVASALATTRQTASARPAPQSSQAALTAQLVTLAATVAVLVWWALRFYLIGA